MKSAFFINNIIRQKYELDLFYIIVRYFSYNTIFNDKKLNNIKNTTNDIINLKSYILYSFIFFSFGSHSKSVVVENQYFAKFLLFPILMCLLEVSLEYYLIELKIVKLEFNM